MGYFTYWYWLLRVHTFTKKKTCLIAKQNECGVHFSVKHPMKEPVHKIQSYFMSCVIVFVYHTSLMWI